MASASIPASRFLPWDPTVLPSIKGPWWWSESQINPLLSMLLLDTALSQQQRKLGHSCAIAQANLKFAFLLPLLPMSWGCKYVIPKYLAQYFNLFPWWPFCYWIYIPPNHLLSRIGLGPACWFASLWRNSISIVLRCDILIGLSSQNVIRHSVHGICCLPANELYKSMYFNRRSVMLTACLTPDVS